MLPGTVGPEDGKGEAKVDETIAAKKAAPSQLFKGRGCTRRSGSVCYATISFDAKEKIPGLVIFPDSSKSRNVARPQE